MNETKTPKWLTDIQNKSWEPEILISGIMLTFLFLLSNYIYNFFLMLIQDYGVWDVVAQVLYRISIILLTGLKIVLILHLTLRGLWTGFVGLSYVFPEGVRKENLPKSDRDLEFEKPEVLVIKVEKICSLLFSFIFTFVSFSIGFLILFGPIILMFIAGLDASFIRTFSLFFFLPVVIGFALLSMFFQKTIKKKIRFFNNIESTYSNIWSTYLTNLGSIKTYIIFILYFLVIVSISLSDIRKFDFRNEKGSDYESKVKPYILNNDHYEDLRNRKLRIPKAAINQFRYKDDEFRLFISFFKEDMYTIKIAEKNPPLIEKYEVKPDSTGLVLPDLYNIKIDSTEVSGLQWYSIDKIITDQKGMFTTIHLDSFKNGYHEILIDKIYWSVDKKEMKLIDNWEIIPFEIAESGSN